MKIFQIGTCKGDDDLTEFISSLQGDLELLVLIEPMREHNEDIIRCYKDVKNMKLENIVINTDVSKKEVEFFYHDNDWPLYEVASLETSHLHKHGYRTGLKSFLVEAMTINDIFSKYKVSDIDLLFMDAEGLDAQIIMSIDFSKYDIKTIVFENLHLGSDQSRLYNHLLDLNYEIRRNIGFNGWSDKATKK